VVRRPQPPVARLLALALSLAAPAARAQVVEVSPERARPGDAFLVTVRGAEAPARGQAAGRELAFYPVDGGWRAVGALPVEAGPGPLPVSVEAGGPPLQASVEVLPAEFPEKRLRVSSRFVERPPPRVRRRIEADRRAFERAFAQDPSPPLFLGRFAWPRRDLVNAGFGEIRTFNGKKESRHYGLDIGGGMGAPVEAAQAGRVALVRSCWASGLSVVLWHGAGLYSTYFHLSRARVKVGQEVSRGQLIGLVGRSGRVTGPHLHWGVKVGEMYVDPESVLRLPF
jgi:murein DD-endopeptidase MepM/ murein hydrolase activator NlpD